MAASVPSMRPPSYGVKEGVNLVPINGLINLKKPYKKYVVVLIITLKDNLGDR